MKASQRIALLVIAGLIGATVSLIQWSRSRQRQDALTKMDEDLDEALEETFPASDATAQY